MDHFNRNESMTLGATPEDLPYWTTVKSMIQPKSVPISTSTHHFRVAFSSGGQIECERVLAPESREMVVVEEYGDFDHFD
ncbi:hypothetical protein PR003_g25839 [Phytophthora rubi]|uniref:Uncharacterized protein n=1 Tax=Phytophthora rubi TaxID=129364 RepID=A0A6A4CBZ3_9STRA|nr:hypothetical protein PR002_g18250 [Phytophthora rubi]KAE9001991.1 hypothetical protein PR001_g18372 [Phytophthora rubi]KAE9288297.1 hypothetical protein PR003_g25839 [Phytophthora rubi]